MYAPTNIPKLNFDMFDEAGDGLCLIMRLVKSYMVG